MQDQPEIPNPDQVFEYPIEALRAFYHNTDAGVFVCDYYTGAIIMCNTKYAETFGKTANEMIGRFCYENMGYTERCPFCPYEKLVDENDRPFESCTWDYYLDSLGIWIQLINRAIRWMDGRLAQIVTFIDITARRKAEERLDLLAFQDRELLVPNAVCLERDLATNTTGTYLLVLQITELRSIADIYSEEISSTLLKMVRDYILSLQIPNSTLYRMAVGDFGILIRHADDDEPAFSVAERLHKRFEREWPLSVSSERQVVFSAADICVIPMDANLTFRYLYRAIRYTLDISRKCGKAVVYDDVINEKFRYTQRMEMNFKNAVRENMEGFRVEYQPIIESSVVTWSGMEALCRWHSPEFGMVPPQEFIPLAEACGLIGKIGKWILEQAISHIKAWGLDRISRFILHVNLSQFQLLCIDLDQIVMELLEKYDYPPERLCLEVTRVGEMNLPKRIRMIERLDSMGVVTALDDFGTGYESFSNLHKLPVKMCKTRHSFINGMENDQHMQHLLYYMIALVHDSDKQLVAKGVETELQARMLINQGADYLQGYFFAKPMSPEKMETQLHNFYIPSEKMLSLVYVRPDVTKPVDLRGSYELSPVQSKLLNMCMWEMFSNPDGNAAIQAVLQYIGCGMNVSRAYVFLKEAEGTYSNTHEWCAPGVPSEIHMLQHLPLEQERAEWIATLAHDGFLVAPDIQTLPPTIAGDLELQGIKAIAAFSILRNNEVYGFVGFDDCNGIHVWTREEVQMLHTLTDIITSTLGRITQEEQIIGHGKSRENLLNSMNTAIYVTDLETNEILFANQGLTKLYSDKPVVGRICWEALHQRTERCESCPVPMLLQNPEENFRWEYFNAVLQRHFRVWDSLIPWDGDKLAHLEYAEDITDLKVSQRELEAVATVDMLTNTLNRAALLAAMKRVLSAAYISGSIVTVAFIDINCLKVVNDTYGHSAGDRLIVGAIKAIQRNIRDNDVIGRYGGDEFLVIFSKCTKEFAEKRIREALNYLAGLGDDQWQISGFGFSYGLVENTEIPYSEATGEYISTLVDIADRRMLNQKKRR